MQAEERKEAELVVLTSETGEYPWHPIRPDQVPEWISQDPDIIGYMVGGQMVRRGAKGPWYRAEKIH